jgi:non-ribosomal peptide synthase protein (TIGR01720 family)
MAIAVPRLPRDLPGSANTEADTRYVHVRIDAATTRAALSAIASRLSISPAAVVLTAVALALRAWTGESRLRVRWVHQGRQGVSPGEGEGHWAQVGFWARFVPILLALPDQGGELPALRAVAEQLAALPHGGTGHMLLRYLTDPARAGELAAAAEPEVLVNFRGYAGNEGRAWTAAVEDPVLYTVLSELKGPSIGPTNRRAALLEIGAEATSGELRFRIGYSAAIHRAATIEALGAGVAAALDRIARLA